MKHRSGSMSGEWKRGTVSYSGTGNRKGPLTRKASPTLPRHSSTLPISPHSSSVGTSRRWCAPLFRKSRSICDMIRA
jgi:hypothetical protein